MIMDPETFTGFVPKSKSVADSTKTSEVLLCLSAENREEVDQIVETAGNGGGKMDPTQLPQMPGMYGRSLEDLDGHVWELIYMDAEAIDASKQECAKKHEGDVAAGVV